MSKGPEANFWNSIRQNLPKKWFATRIENKHGGGVPDVHIVADGVPFWLELKVSNSNAVKVSPHQIAWHLAYYARGGASFFLVKAPSQGLIYSFGGEQGPDLLGKGLLGTEGQGFRTVGEALSALRPSAACILGIDPAAPRGG